MRTESLSTEVAPRTGGSRLTMWRSLQIQAVGTKAASLKARSACLQTSRFTKSGLRPVSQTQQILICSQQVLEFTDSSDAKTEPYSSNWRELKRAEARALERGIYAASSAFGSTGCRRINGHSHRGY